MKKRFTEVFWAKGRGSERESGRMGEEENLALALTSALDEN
jgi:hypothetical protein